MLKTLSKIFPLLDYLYIFQTLEYNLKDFLTWFLKHPLERNLQRKKHLEVTQKVLILSIGNIILELTTLIILIFYLKNIWVFISVLILLQLITPFLIIISYLLYLPFDIYIKQRRIQEAKTKLKRMQNLHIVAITGSFGKTSTKEILYTLLWKRFNVVKTPKSFNTLLGVAQTIWDDLKETNDIFIVEIGAYKIGEITELAKLAKPQIGIITAIAPQHLERFGSLEKIAQAKFELVENLPADGLAILNSKFEWLKTLTPKSPAKVVFYGQKQDPYYATNVQVNGNGTSFNFHTPKTVVNIEIPLIGEHHVDNFIAASVAALKLGLSLKELKQRAKLLLPTPHRMEIKKMGNMILIDNSFNSNPVSASSSLKLLATFVRSRKIVITPGFVELGKEAVVVNQEFGQEIRRVADEVIIIGQNAKQDLLRGLNSINHLEKTVHLVKTTQEALTLAQQLANGKETVALLENDLPDQYS